MYPVSDAFKAEIRKTSWTPVTLCEFWIAGAYQRTVPVLSGSLTDDSTASIRRTVSLAFSGKDPLVTIPGVSDWETNPFWPLGTEIKLYAGVRFPIGTTELVPQGVFRLSKPVIRNSSDGDFSISVDGYDRSRAVSRAKFLQPYWIAKGTDVGTALKTLLQRCVPILGDEDFVFMPTDGSDEGEVFTTPWIVYTPDDDPWEKALELAASVGCELYFDGIGRPTMQPIKDPAYSPSEWDYIEGPTCTMTSLERNLDEDSAYNGIRVISNPNDSKATFAYTVWDINPNSPTYFDPIHPDDSAYGPYPTIVKTTVATSAAQVKRMAEALFAARAGIIEQVHLTAVPNYAHWSGDIVAIKESDSRADVTAFLEAFQMGLGFDGTFSGTTRRRKILA